MTINWPPPQPPPQPPQYPYQQPPYGQQYGWQGQQYQYNGRPSPGGGFPAGIIWLVVILLIVGGTIGGIYYATNGAVLNWFSPPSITSFKASPESINTGGSAKLDWAVKGAQTVSISPDIGTVSASGSQSVKPGATTEYMLTASNISGSTRAWATVTVTKPGKPSISGFSATPATITAGQSTTLSWNVAGATTVSISPTIGSVSATGSKTMAPTETTTYTITAVNDTGTSTMTAKITVNPSGPPDITSFTASPASITSGSSSTLSWTVSGATSVSIDQAIGTMSNTGTKSVSPTTTTTYTLTASNSLGSSTKTAVVTVTAAGLPVITAFTASPSSIASGDNVTLSWAVTGATTINIAPSVGTVSATGTRTLNPTATTTYTLTATNNSGPVTATATVTVAAAGSPTVSSFYASPVTVASGSSVTLHWEVINATGVTITPGIGTVSTTGAQSVTLTATTTYLLTATNDNGTVTASATVTVASAGYPVISSFTAGPATVPSGQSTALSWTVTNASTVTIDHSIGTVSASGTRTITPAATTTYTITATNSQGLSTATATVTVTTTSGTPPDITSFTASPTTISAGGSSQLRWQISGATSISIQPYEGEPSSWGYIDVYPTETTTYTLTAFNSSGSDTATVTVTVSP